MSNVDPVAQQNFQLIWIRDFLNLISVYTVTPERVSTYVYSLFFYVHYNVSVFRLIIVITVGRG